MSEYYKEVKDDRTHWFLFTPSPCMICQSNPGAETHEIEKRSAAPGRWGQRCNYLKLCRGCHDETNFMPHAQQLAYKLVFDPKHFDLDGWLRLRDPDLAAPERVTMADIAQYLSVKA